MNVLSQMMYCVREHVLNNSCITTSDSLPDQHRQLISETSLSLNNFATRMVWVLLPTNLNFFCGRKSIQSDFKLKSWWISSTKYSSIEVITVSFFLPLDLIFPLFSYHIIATASHCMVFYDNNHVWTMLGMLSQFY